MARYDLAAQSGPAYSGSDPLGGGGTKGGGGMVDEAFAAQAAAQVLL